MAWTLRALHFTKLRMTHHHPVLAKLRMAHHQVLFESLTFSADNDHATLSCTKALKNAGCESIETTISKRRVFFAPAMVRQLRRRPVGNVQDQAVNRRLGINAFLTTSKWSEQPRDTRNAPRWCLELRLRCDPLQKIRWARDTGLSLEAAQRFMGRWHEGGAKTSRQHHASFMGGVQRNGEGG